MMEAEAGAILGRSHQPRDAGSPRELEKLGASQRVIFLLNS